jgi:hypothetical protein
LVRSGANSAFTYHIYFTGSSCASTGNCTLTVQQEPALSGWSAPSRPAPSVVLTPTTVDLVPNVLCTQCITASPTGTLPFVFSNSTGSPVNSIGVPTVPSASLSLIQGVGVTLTIVSAANHAASTTLTSQVLIPNALGAL